SPAFAGDSGLAVAGVALPLSTSITGERYLITDREVCERGCSILL
ncbi:MAG: hypothetical protein RLZZ07_940, partial [Actinomycetota bacterium]